MKRAFLDRIFEIAVWVVAIIVFAVAALTLIEVARRLKPH